MLVRILKSIKLIVYHIKVFLLIFKVTEYAHSRSLYECLLSKNAKREYTIEILIKFLKQITSAMSYLEKKILIHRDLAIRNILVFNKSLVSF